VATIPTPRRISQLTAQDKVGLIGSVVSSLALVDLVYEHVLATSGTLGFLVSWYVVFLATYAVVVATWNGIAIVIERLVTATLWVVALIVVGALASTVLYTFVHGSQALSHLNFFVDDMSGVSPTAPLNQGGIAHAIAGSFVEVGIAVVIALPLGLTTAVFMSEVGGRAAHSVRTVVEAMTALPEILAGLFIYVVLIVEFGMAKSGLAAAVAMAVTMVPIIARAGEVALRVVPAGLRDAAQALGATHWSTTIKVVLPSARAGLATALILAVARGVGETAVVLITSGASSFFSLNPVGAPMNSLPLFIFTSFATHEPVALQRAFGAASVLLFLVLLAFLATRLLSKDRSQAR
jgi:phosphate transport system permease protein